MEAMKGETRTPKQIIVLGTNGTGKTTLVKELVLSELKKTDSHVLIVVPDDMEWNSVPFVHSKFPSRIEKYVGVRKVIYYDGLLEVIRDHFRNGLLIFDDCRAYLKNSLDGELHAILIRRRQQMIDIVAVGHGFSEVPPKMFTFATHYALFKTIDNIKRRMNVIQNYEEMKEKQLFINQKAITDPHYKEIIKV